MSNNVINVDLSLINDVPLENSEHDFLDFEVYAQVLSEAMKNTPTPFNLAIYGECGNGKTSLMKLVSNEFSLTKNKKQKIISISFDSLKFENENNPFLILLDLIQNQIENFKNSFDADITNVSDNIKSIKLAVLNIKNEKNSISAEYFHDCLLGENEEKQLVNQKTYLEIYELLIELEKLLNEDDFQIIVFIDNLDKCNSSNIIKILEVINVIFNLKGLSFVIAANKNMLLEQLDKKVENNESYLDKIIQLPFHLPSFSGKVSSLLDKLYLKNGSNANLNQNIKNVIQSITSSNKVTPRFIIRVINRIQISSKIYLKLNPNSQLSEKNIYSLFSVSCVLEELFSEFHSHIIKNKQIAKYLIKIVQNELFYKQELEESLSTLHSINNVIIETIENNFNVIKMIFSTQEGKYWLENEKNRIATYEFLKTSSLIENVEIDSSPIYKTNFLENIIKIEDEAILDYKEFIKIPNEDYEFSKYVITNSWFEEFIKSGGYDNPQYWTEMASKIWLIDNRIKTLEQKYEKMLQNEEKNYKKRFKQELIVNKFNKPLQPVVYITYFETLAFCKYLSDIDTEYNYFVPTKEQWEYVASAGDLNNIYPWGANWNNNYCNNLSNQLYKTTEIGMFPQGNSKFGVSDMAGNIWVWTSSFEDNEFNYLKGGSWNFSDPLYFKISNKQMNFYNNPSYQHYDIGFYCIRRKKYT